MAPRPAIYQRLAAKPDHGGVAGAVESNFEKFLLDGSGHVVRRFRPDTEPEDFLVVQAIERLVGAR